MVKYMVNIYGVYSSGAIIFFSQILAFGESDWKTKLNGYGINRAATDL